MSACSASVRSACHRQPRVEPHRNARTFIRLKVGSSCLIFLGHCMNVGDDKKHSVVTFEVSSTTVGSLLMAIPILSVRFSVRLKRPGRHPSALTEPFDLGSAQIETFCPSRLRFQLLEPAHSQDQLCVRAPYMPPR
jgi:hypothetical protein